MRLFIGVELSKDLKKTLTATLHEMKQAQVRGNYVPIQNMHMTMAFIGETKDVDAVKDAMRNAQFKPFKLAFGDMGTFGDILWVGIKGNQGLSAAVKSVRDALDAAGIDYDRQNFTPHITLIRKMSGAWKKVKAPRGDMVVKKISLLKSEQKDGKQVYTEIFSI